MLLYEQQIWRELQVWQRKMTKTPSLTDHLTHTMQLKVNKVIPEKVHQAITSAMKQMVRGVLFGAQHTTGKILQEASLQYREEMVKERIKFYKRTAATEGGLTGLGGILLGLADFPILLGIKLTLLFEIAALYGHDVNDFKERLYILYIFQLAFSSQHNRRKVFDHISNWKDEMKKIPRDINEFDWRTFQQEYRDYIDLAKMAQLIPGIGAVVGFIVNYRLLNQLGKTAMNAYRMRWLEERVGSRESGDGGRES